MALPPEFSEGGSDFLLPAEPDHQTKGVFDRLLFRCTARSLL